MNTFQLIITSCNEILFEGPAVRCFVTTIDGALGLESRHEQVLCVLKENSSINYTESSGDSISIKIANGMLSFKKNECRITMVRQ